MKKLILSLLLINCTQAADIATVNSGDPITSTKMNEIIDGVNNAGGLIKDTGSTAGSHCAEWRMSPDTYKAALVPINCTTKKAIGLSIREGAYEIGNGSNLSSCQEYRNHQLYTGQGDGVYWIDPDGDGAIPEHKVYCDMDGAYGWTLIFSSQTVSGTADKGSNTPTAALTTLNPSGSSTTVYTPYTSVNAIKFSCDGAQNGSLDYTGIQSGNSIYNIIKNDVDGYINPGFDDSSPEIKLDDDLLIRYRSNYDKATDPDFGIDNVGNTIFKWGTVDESNGDANDDICNHIDYSRTPSGAVTLTTTGTAYFYIFIR